jgi:hypothetical protein
MYRLRCLRCENDFIALRPHAVFCPTKCRMSGYRRRQSQKNNYCGDSSGPQLGDAALRNPAQAKKRNEGE